MRAETGEKPDSSSLPTDDRMGGWSGVTFDELAIGQWFPSKPLTRSLDEVRRFNRVTGWGPHESETIPAFLLNELGTIKSFLTLPPGVLHAKEKLKLRGAARAGEKLEVRVGIVDKQVRNGKRFVVVEQEITSAEDRRAILSIRRTFYWPR